MKKITLFLSVLASVYALTGCTTANEAVKAAAAKNVNASGVVSVQDIQTGYDPVTGSVTPKVLLVTGSLHYRSNVVSVPEGSKVPDAAEYSREESASIWNAEAKSVNVRWSFTASTPEQAAARMKALLDYDAAKTQESTGTHAKAQGNAVSAPADMIQAAEANNEPAKAQAAPEGPSEAVAPE